ncbi:hypothetical protein BESB_057160 [Besnoitia besnoiti]|uniref:Calcium uniporter protein C-terminal domain-containing protein n=1 Tax=Besnoitia besnoiti TaxID=94643 RepID=A0A2A9MDJ2_BESBE|nr:hypothetical protein BESB_057160 [Besnoitia besnoiti]PFH36065.1 hypothetical protein BESB_057160 [Besnoitia besnoiti]
MLPPSPIPSAAARSLLSAGGGPACLLFAAGAAGRRPLGAAPPGSVTPLRGRDRDRVREARRRRADCGVPSGVESPSAEPTCWFRGLRRLLAPSTSARPRADSAGLLGQVPSVLRSATRATAFSCFVPVSSSSPGFQRPFSPASTLGCDGSRLEDLGCGRSRFPSLRPSAGFSRPIFPSPLSPCGASRSAMTSAVPAPAAGLGSQRRADETRPHPPTPSAVSLLERRQEAQTVGSPACPFDVFIDVRKGPPPSFFSLSFGLYRSSDHAGARAFWGREPERISFLLRLPLGVGDRPMPPVDLEPSMSVSAFKNLLAEAVESSGGLQFVLVDGVRTLDGIEVADSAPLRELLLRGFSFSLLLPHIQSDGRPCSRSASHHASQSFSVALWSFPSSRSPLASPSSDALSPSKTVAALSADEASAGEQRAPSSVPLDTLLAGGQNAGPCALVFFRVWPLSLVDLMVRRAGSPGARGVAEAPALGAAGSSPPASSASASIGTPVSLSASSPADGAVKPTELLALFPVHADAMAASVLSASRAYLTRRAADRQAEGGRARAQSGVCRPERRGLEAGDEEDSAAKDSARRRRQECGGRTKLKAQHERDAERDAEIVQEALAFGVLCGKEQLLKKLLSLQETLDMRMSNQEKQKELKARLDRRAGSVRGAVAWSMCALLSAQASLVFYGTYFLYSWDIIEPLTYLLGAFDVCVAYAFHAATSSDYSPHTFVQSIVERRRRRAYRAANFDASAFYREAEQLQRLQDNIRQLQSAYTLYFGDGGCLAAPRPASMSTSRKTPSASVSFPSPTTSATPFSSFDDSSSENRDMEKTQRNKENCARL